jgi:hypothetical protein
MTTNEHRELLRLRDELGDWHATFPSRKPEEVLKLLDERERKGRQIGLMKAAAVVRDFAERITGSRYSEVAVKLEAEADTLEPSPRNENSIR